jgi:hypothetical protein
MALSVNLFVHGVPQGQKIWGSKGDDSLYLSSFYGPKWDVPEVMKIDIMTFGGTTYCYYTLVKGQNIYDLGGRAGAYFALTLRMNAYYADIQNLYNILMTVYNKFCIDCCLKENNGMLRFIHADFVSIDQQLKDIESQLLEYIRNFSVPKDIVSLAEFPASRQGVSSNINLHECTTNIAFNAIKQNGTLMVSPWFPDARSAEVISQYKNEMRVIAQRAEQEVKMYQQSAADQIEAVNKAAEERVVSLQRKAADEQERLIKEIEAIKQKAQENLDSLKDKDKRIEYYRQKLGDAESTIEGIKREIEKNDTYSLRDQSYANSTDNYNKKKQHNSGQKNVVSYAGNNTSRKLLREKPYIYGGVGALLSIITIGIVMVLFPSKQTGKITSKYGTTEAPSQTINTKDAKLSPSKQARNTTSKSGIAETPSLAINIRELKNPKDSLVPGKSYYLSIGDPKGTFKSDDGKIEGNTFTVYRGKAGGDCKISYVDEKGKEIAKGTFYVKKE